MNYRILTDPKGERVLALTVYGAGDHSDNHDVAILPLGVPMLDQWLNRIDRVRAATAEDHALYSHEYFDAGGNYEEECNDDEPYSPADWDEPGRTESDCCVANHDGVCFSAFIKHTDCRIETAQLSYEDIKALRDAEEARS